MKKVVLAAGVMCLAMAGSMVSYAGEWGQDEKGYYYNNDAQSYAHNIIQKIDGAFYGFDNDGYMMKGWKQLPSGMFYYDGVTDTKSCQNSAGKWVYFDPNTGVQTYGWAQLDGKWYYFDGNDFGCARTGWLEDGNKTYHFDDSGAMQTNTVFYIEDRAYEVDASGNLKRDQWAKSGDGRSVHYRADGVIEYINDTSRQYSAAVGGGSLDYVREDMAALKEGYQSEINDAVKDAQAMLTEVYYKRVYTAKSSKKDEMTQKWENKVQRHLAPMTGSDVIQKYIKDVEAGAYYNAYLSGDYYSEASGVHDVNDDLNDTDWDD